VLCVPGGGGVNALLEDPETLAFVRRQAEGGAKASPVEDCTGASALATRSTRTPSAEANTS
jgi:cyclohexyl-isocyanide hydratase